jgi:hypothetical protein
MFPVSCMLRFETILFKIYIQYFSPKIENRLSSLISFEREWSVVTAASVSALLTCGARLHFNTHSGSLMMTPVFTLHRPCLQIQGLEFCGIFMSTYSPFIITDYVTWYFKLRSYCMITHQCLYLIRFILYVLCDKSFLTKPIKLMFSFSKVYQYKPAFMKPSVQKYIIDSLISFVDEIDG